MARRKPSPLVQAIAAFNALDEKDRATLADYIRTQTPRNSRNTTKKSRKPAESQGSEAVKGAGA
jgi:cytochrome c553